ncbi:hypothetical protein [Brevundimonas sp.]|uniref:hypothetical protein n=1 Tax=Brevundimonas sp. TaxID=1871086 RepID=UPI0028A9F873|nr:hypothetical protein [Brevundimonas sp.]
MLTDRLQVLLTAQLIKRCGGLEEASRACEASGQPYSVAQLSRCQTLNSGCSLPLRIIVCLEEYCGEPVIGKSLVEARPSNAHIDCAMTEAAETTEAAAGFQSKVRKAVADGVVTAAEQAELEREAEALFEQARQSREAVQRLRVAA